jgi:hypothetical protein
MELFADGLGERAGNVAVVEIQRVDREENEGGEEQASRVGFLGHVRMLAEEEVVSRQRIAGRGTEIRSGETTLPARIGVGRAVHLQFSD